MGKKWVHAWVGALLPLLLAACGGGGAEPGDQAPPAMRLGGQASGLAGPLLLRDALAGELRVERDGPFVFPQPLPAGASYHVEVAQPPAGQACAIAQGSGMAQADVGSVRVECASRMTTVSVRVDALQQPIELVTAGGETMPIAATGTYALAARLAPGQPYAVTVRSPHGQPCSVVDGRGVATGEPVLVRVGCASRGWRLGGTVENLGGAVALRNSDGQELTLTRNGRFAFESLLADGAAYAVQVIDQSPGEACGVTLGSGLATGNVEDIVVRCAPVIAAPPLPMLPAAPAALSVTYTVKTYAFAWSATAGATRYQLLEDPDGAGPLAAAPVGADTTGTTATQTHAVLLPAKLNAEYAVRACNAAGCGPATPWLRPDLRRAIGYFKAGNTGAGDQFGTVAALSADGRILAVAALAEASAARGVGGDGSDNSAPEAGAAYVYALAGGVWVQQAYLKASNTDARDANYGISLALSADGSTLALGLPAEDSRARGINGSQGDNSAPEAGAVYVFTRAGTSWSQQAYVKASNTDGGDLFGYSVALSADGGTLAVGAAFEWSAATGVGGDQVSFGAARSGAAYVFTRSGTTWSQQAYVKASNTQANDLFGLAVALSADGHTLAVSAYREDSGATGVNGSQADNSAPDSGAVYVFTRAGSAWSQQAYLKAGNTGADDGFGIAIALSSDGHTLAVGAWQEDGAATGVGGDPSSNGAADAGAVYVFTRAGSTWSQQAYIKASNTAADDRFGYALALSGDGNTLAVGAYQEDSSALGVAGNQADNAAADAGAVYLYRRTGATWAQRAYLKAPNTAAGDAFGSWVALSADGATLAVGAPGEASSAAGVNGDQADNAAAQAGAVYLY